MSKKDFKGGLDSLLGEIQSKPKKAPVREVTKSTQEGTKEGEARATFIVNEALVSKLKAIAYWDRILLKDVINTAISDYVKKYESKHGTIKEMPKR